MTNSYELTKHLPDKIEDLDLRREMTRTLNDGSNLERCVRVFHQLYNLPIVKPEEARLDFSHISKERLAMRFGLIVEEFMELCDAMDIRADINFFFLDEEGKYVKANDPDTIEVENTAGQKSEVETHNYYMDGHLMHDYVSDDMLHQIVRGRLQHSILETDERDIVDVADACGDLKYVIQGFELETGIPGPQVLLEIQRSNMSKLGEDGKPIYREDGKVLKGPNYFQAHIYETMRTHGLKITSASQTRI